MPGWRNSCSPSFGPLSRNTVAEPRASLISFYYFIFPFQALKIAAWEEGDLEVMNGFTVFAKQMWFFYGHQTSGLALPSWKSELPQNCLQILAKLVVSEEN